MTPRARPTVLAGLLVALLPAACGRPEAPDHGTPPQASTSAPEELRQVVPMGSERVASTPVATLDAVYDDVDLAAHDTWEQPLALAPGKTYRVVLEYSGAEPILWCTANDQPDAVRLQVVTSQADRIEALYRARAASCRLEIRAFHGATRLRHLRVRRWASNHVTSEPPPPGQLARIDVGRDTRPALVLPHDEPFELPFRFPDNASRLELAWAPAPGSTGGTGSLRVTWVQPGLRDRKLLRAAVGSSLSAWNETLIDIGRFAGQQGTLRVTVLDAEPAAMTTLAVPEVLCERGTRRPNLLLVSLDTTRPDHMGAYGYGRDTTPRLSELARRGVLCEQLRSVSAYTLPSHTTMFSGMHPLGHGVRHPGHAIDCNKVPLLADLLRQQGYATRAFTGSGYVSADFGFAYGFASYGEYDPLRPFTSSEQAWMTGTPHRSAELARMAAAQSLDGAMSWIEQHREVPFFLFVHTFMIHDYRPEPEDRQPFGAPPLGQGVKPLRGHQDQQHQPYTGAEREQLRALYDAALAGVDRRLGQLLDKLDELGLRDETLVVITGDHGETLGEHGSAGVPLVGHAFGLWNEQVSIPLILAGPGLSPLRLAEPISLIDLAPTLLDLLGQPVPQAMQGVSLRPWLTDQGAPADRPRPSPVLLDLLSPTNQSRALYSHGMALLVGDPHARVTQPVEQAVALYDLTNDPGQTHDLSQEQPDTVARMQRELAALSEHYAASGTSALPVELSEETLATLAELGYLER